jgi:NAD(P)-dependent dehydrogenase (short-subunit alcohol dehydrogenase family)
MNFNNLNAEKGYHPGNAYGQSKLANLLFTYELQQKFEKEDLGTIAAAAHPGWTVTNLQVHWRMLRILNPFIGQKPDMGALSSLFAATAPEVQGGSYYGPSGWMELRGHPTKVQSSGRSQDATVATKLWTVSEELTDVQYQWTTTKAPA